MARHHDTYARHTRPVPAAFGLTGCCPRPTLGPGGVRLGPSPTEWQQAWACQVYQTWCGGPTGRPLVDGAAYCLNLGDAAFVAPTEHTTYLSGWPATAATGLAAVWGLSWLDRVPGSPVRALRQAAQALAPGGLLALTFALWDAEGEDCALGHEGRQRIFTPKSWRELVVYDLPKIGCQLLGPADWHYRGHACGDHSLATIVAVRKAAQ